LGRFIDVCNAVGYAHSRGVIHRDIKPANVMLGDFGETLVLDWGLARSLSPTANETSPFQPLPVAESGTVQGQVLGTPAFMPPEQALGQADRVGTASDVFALGATLYNLLTSRAPYVAPDVLTKAQNADSPPPRQINPLVPRALQAVCLKAMA